MSDDEFVTNLTDRSGAFRNTPRTSELDLSVLRGRLTVEDALTRVVGAFGPEKADENRVRYARAGDLRAKGFIVWHTPRRRIKGDIHASILIERDGEYISPWSKAWQELLATCFNQIDG